MPPGLMTSHRWDSVGTGGYSVNSVGGPAAIGHALWLPNGGSSGIYAFPFVLIWPGLLLLP